jgi:putative ATP-binding cassette transporter
MEFNKLDDVFWKTSPNLYFLTIVLNSLSGIAYITLIPFITYSVEEDYKKYLYDADFTFSFLDSPSAKLSFGFLILICTVIVLKTSSMIISDFIRSKATSKLRIELCRRLNRTSIENIESMGYAKVANLINIDTNRLTGAAMALPGIWVHSVTVIGVLGYLTYIDIAVFVMVIVCLTIGIVTYQAPLFFASKALNIARTKEDEVQEGCRGLVLGAKELKLDRDKAVGYIEDEIVKHDEERRRYSFKGMSIFLLAENYGSMIVMLVIGLTIFYLPYLYNISILDLIGAVMALLYVTGPVAIILQELNEIKVGEISLKKVVKVFEKSNAEIKSTGREFNQNWQQLSLRNVGYEYSGDAEKKFSISAIDLVINKGEIVFIVGGNGSGKSTLAKIISTHYQYQEGDYQIDGQSLTDFDLDSFRKNIYSIYTDFFLFPKLYSDFDNSRAKELLKYLNIDHKVTIDNGFFSTTRLSDGQRKRVALMSGILDNRHIYIFDEWAADQDPEFKDVFYYTILPKLKSENKTVIVISHDDRYFKSADKLVEMEDGKIRNIREVKLSDQPQIELIES